MTERDISWVSKEDAYQMGLSTGEWMERERIIALLLDGWCRDDSPLIAAINGENE